MKIKLITLLAIAISVLTITSCKKKVADINVTSASTSIVSGGTKDFGTVAKGSTEADNKLDFVIESSGTKELNVSSIEISGTNAANFTLDTKVFANGTIAKGSSQIFSVSLKTATVGDFNASVIIKSDASSAASYTVGLTGSVQ
jgi:hypothetical protein